jgi:hypothetical protein
MEALLETFSGRNIALVAWDKNYNLHALSRVNGKYSPHREVFPAHTLRIETECEVVEMAGFLWQKLSTLIDERDHCKSKGSDWKIPDLEGDIKRVREALDFFFMKVLKDKLGDELRLKAESSRMQEILHWLKNSEVGYAVEFLLQELA